MLRKSAVEIEEAIEPLSNSAILHKSSKGRAGARWARKPRTLRQSVPVATNTSIFALARHNYHRE